MTCTATDKSGNQATDSFTVTVHRIQHHLSSHVPGDQTVEVTSADGAIVTFTPPSAPSATDIFDFTIECTSDTGPTASGQTFPLGVTTVTCIATDDNGNESPPGVFTVTGHRIQHYLSSHVPDDITVEATSVDGAAVPFTVSADDAIDGPITPDCDHQSGETFPLGDTLVTCPRYR